jgi:hypothetical protein
MARPEVSDSLRLLLRFQLSINHGYLAVKAVGSAFYVREGGSLQLEGMDASESDKQPGD